MSIEEVLVRKWLYIKQDLYDIIAELCGDPGKRQQPELFYFNANDRCHPAAMAFIWVSLSTCTGMFLLIVVPSPS